MKNRILLISLAALLALSIGLVGCNQGQSTPSLTVFSTSGGNVSVMKADAAGWIEGEVGMSLEPGDVIKCGDDSGAQITFVDGSTIELQAGTEIEVALLDVTDAGCAIIRLRQVIGTIIFRVIKMIDPGCLYEVETPSAMVAVRGSAVQIYVIQDGTTWACNLGGDIWAIAQGVELQLPEGRCCVIRHGEPPKLICDLAIISTTGGSVTIPIEGTFPYDAYDEGTVVDLVAEPEAGYHFVNWSGDVDTVADMNAASTTITMNDDYSIIANFAKEYDLIIASTEGGNVTAPGEGSYGYDEGDVVNLIAEADAGYQFVEWTGDVGTIANVDAASTTITMNGDYSVTANFAVIPPAQYSLAVSSTAGGSVTTPGEGTFSRDVGTVVNLVANPGICDQFVNWTGDTDSIADVNDSTTTITMNSDYSIVANFEEEEAVVFPDPNLMIAIRVAMDNPGGPICPSDLGRLTYLDASDSNIADLTGLEYCTSLEGLDLNGNQITNVSPLANLTSLRQVFLMQNQISDLSPLVNLTSLDTVDLGYNQLSDVSPLANLINLTQVNLAHNQISDISCLSNLANPSWVSLGNNQISDISPLANLTSLQYLYLRSNQISDISPLAGLTNLTDLDVNDNQISNLSPLANLTSLGQLFLDQNQISNLSPLANLTSLYSLRLWYNQISDISPLANLTNLPFLYLRSNQISDISPLAAVTDLCVLDVRDNQISDLSPLANLANLEVLYLQYNQISDISPLVQNEALGQGDEVWLQGNPLSSDSINIYIPQLQARGVTVYY